MKKENIKMTIEDLAKIVKEGFGTMATKTDLEDLAIITAKGFEGVSNRFNGVDRQINGMKTGIEGLERKVEGLELKISSYASSWSRDFDRLHEWMEELDKRVNKVEDKLVRK